MNTNILSYVLSAMSLLSLWLVGNKNKIGFVVGLINQILWAVYAVSLKQWGLLGGVVAYTFINIRNLIKWNKDSK